MTTNIAADLAQMKLRLEGMLNVRRMQTGARAAQTQRKLEALAAQIRKIEKGE